MARRDEPTTDSLRGRIDRGETGDKVMYPDPAMAPLGTDDEAAGRPPSPEAIALAARHERGGSSANAPATNENPTTKREMSWIYLVVAAVFAAAAFGVVVWRT